MSRQQVAATSHPSGTTTDPLSPTPAPCFILPGSNHDDNPRRHPIKRAESEREREGWGLYDAATGVSGSGTKKEKKNTGGIIGLGYTTNTALPASATSLRTPPPCRRRRRVRRILARDTTLLRVCFFSSVFRFRDTEREGRGGREKRESQERKFAEAIYRRIRFIIDQILSEGISPRFCLEFFTQLHQLLQERHEEFRRVESATVRNVYQMTSRLATSSRSICLAKMYSCIIVS